METKKYIIASFLIFCFVIATAQENKTFWNEKMLNIAYQNEYKDWVDIREDHFFTKENFFTENRDAFSFTEDDDMRYISSTTKDELGYTRHLFQQTYKGIDIEHAQYKLHEKEGRIFCANGRSVQKINGTGYCNTEPKISEELALQYALENINAKMYAWEIERELLSEKDRELPAYNYPKGTLLITELPDNLSSEKETFVLAYKFQLSAIEPSSSIAVYVCANTGKILKQHSLSYENAHEGQALTLYYGWQTIITYKKISGKYILEDDTRGNGIGTYDGVSDIRDVNYKDADNHWSLESERPATTVHWGMGITYDYFYNVHGRNSYDGNGKFIKSHIIDGEDNAAWSLDRNRFGFGNSSNNANRNPVASLDVVGHEFTHAVISYSQNPLVNTSEAGALGESFGDIFGTMVEFYVLGNNGNYYQGENIIIGGNGMLRDMSNPHNTQHPKTYRKTYWYNGNNSSDYVHINCGVQNYWFYLLAEGGSGTNDNGYSYSIQGVGRDKAAKIVYRSMTNGYLTPTSQYLDAAISSTRAAMELYGNCSYEATQVYKAWQAVGVNFPLSSLPRYNITTNCSQLHSTPGGTVMHPIYFYAINKLTSFCQIISYDPITFHAGNEIVLLPGFTSNSNFHAYITPCDLSGFNEESSSAKSFGNTPFFVNDENSNNNASIKNRAITLFPNPNTGSFTIGNIDVGEMQQIQVINLLGQVIYAVQNPTDNTITLPSKVKGTFFVRIVTSTESVTRKIVVE